MPNVQGPLFSLGASGTVANTITYQKNRDRKIARSKPTLPPGTTPPQADSRSIIRWLNDFWRVQATLLKFTWNLNIGSTGKTGYNQFISENMRALSAGTLLENLLGSSAKGQGLAMSEMSLTRFGAGATVNSPSFPVPPGWTLQFRIAFAMHNLDPRISLPTDTNFGLDPGITGPYKVNIVDNTPPLVATQFIYWQKPDLSFAMSHSVSATIV